MRIYSILALILVTTIVMAEPRSGVSNEEMEWARKIVSDQRHQAVLADMGFSTAHEEKKFFGIYNMYREEMNPIQKKEDSLLRDYSNAYLNKNLTEDQALIFVNTFLDLKSQRIALKKKYVAELGKVMSPKYVARFIQIENKLDAIMNYKIGRTIPLVPVND